MHTHRHIHKHTRTLVHKEEKNSLIYSDPAYIGQIFLQCAALGFKRKEKITEPCKLLPSS